MKMPSTDRVRFGDQGRRTTRFERWRGGETGAFLAVAAQEIALGPTWWYLGFLVVCGVLMVGWLAEESEQDRNARSGRPSAERVRLTGLYVLVLVVAAASVSLDARLSMWMAGAVSLVVGGVAHWRRPVAPVRVPLFLTAGVLLILLGAVAES